MVESLRQINEKASDTSARLERLQSRHGVATLEVGNAGSRPPCGVKLARFGSAGFWMNCAWVCLCGGLLLLGIRAISMARNKSESTRVVSWLDCKTS
jgi:hypothetical protein